MFAVKQKIEHLKSLGITGDLKELEKMYAGQSFNTADPSYLQLLQISSNLCEEINITSYLIAELTKRNNEQLKTKLELESHKQSLIDALFPGHGQPLFGNFNKLKVIVGLVDAEGFNYINFGTDFGVSSLVHLGQYSFVAPKCKFGQGKLNPNTNRLNTIFVGNDTWICSSVQIEDGSQIPEKCTVALASTITNKCILQPQTLVAGTPAKSFKRIEKGYTGKSEQIVKIRTEQEIQEIFNHVRTLGIDGDFSEYRKMLNCQRYNCLDPIMSQIHDLSHTLTDEYNNPNTTDQRREQIKDALFFNHGKNFSLGKNIYVDVLGAVKVGNDVVVKDDVNFAGNVELENNVVVNNDCIIQAIGHDPYYENRHLTQTESGGLSEITTSGTISIKENTTLANGTKVVPGVTVSYNTQPNELVLK